MADKIQDEKAPRWAWILLILIVAIPLLSIATYQCRDFLKKSTVKSASSRTAAVQKPTRIEKIILQPGEKKSYTIPPRHWFRVYSDDKVEATDWRGKKQKGTAWLGDDIQHVNFVLKSNEKTKNATVVVTLRPK